MSWRARKVLCVFLIATTGLGFAWAWSEPKFLQHEQQQEQESKAAAEESSSLVTEEEVTAQQHTAIERTTQNPWQPTDFANQPNALGWSPEVFTVPAGMEARVSFWRDIYTKYSTDQGVLHDSLHVAIVYGEVDFRPIMQDRNLTDRQKQKARRKLVDERKREIREQILRLAKVTDPTELTGEDLRLWNLFNAIDESNKFQLATSKKRLRFQLGQSDRFRQGIYYSGRYLRSMEKVFREKGLPIELTRLPFVESSFNVNARSRVGASGIWQFMRYTGRQFMRINHVVDERNDPVRATEAAARLFTINFNMLGKWPLAITGYNHGPAGVQRVVKKFKTDDIAELVDERNGRFGFASANFYACFLAALDVERNAKEYFSDKLYWDTPLDAKEIRLSQAINKKIVLSWFAGDLEKAKEFNPHLSRGFWVGYNRIGSKEFIRVPTSSYETALSDLSSVSRMTAQSDDGGSDIEYYLVTHGDTLTGIAAQLGVSTSLLRELNSIDNPRSLRPGQKLTVPARK